MNKIYKLTIRAILLSALFVLMSTSAYAVTCTSNAGGGDWNLSGTWDCPAVPAAGDNVVINSSVYFTADIAQVNNITIADGGILEQQNTNQQTITGDMVIESGGKLTHADNAATVLCSTNICYEVNFYVDNFYLNAGGEVNVNALGYKSNYGPSTGENSSGQLFNGDGGGANGGDGGDEYFDLPYSTLAAGGTAYCDVNSPGHGSGGGNQNPHAVGQGGGLVILEAQGEIQLNANIFANGNNGMERYSSNTGTTGGGAGGGVKLTANSFTGNAFVYADGGDAVVYSFVSGGGGGGGCVNLIYTSSSTIDSNNIFVNGGDSWSYCDNNIVHNEDQVACETGGGVYTINKGGGGNGLIQITQNAVLAAPEFSNYLYFLTLLTALSLIYCFGRSKKLNF